MKRLIIFASGSGTNAENIINYFSTSSQVTVVKVLSNKKDAFALKRATKLQIANGYFSKEEFTSDEFIDTLVNEADYLILAGFLWKIPAKLVKAFQHKIFNIHPALLPNYGGKGMYGMNVHNAVVENKEENSGITIHYVNEHYDEGAIIYQHSVKLSKDETPESLATKVHALEYEYFPKVIEKVILNDTY